MGGCLLKPSGFLWGGNLLGIGRSADLEGSRAIRRDLWSHRSGVGNCIGTRFDAHLGRRTLAVPKRAQSPRVRRHRSLGNRNEWRINIHARSTTRTNTPCARGRTAGSTTGFHSTRGRVDQSVGRVGNGLGFRGPNRNGSISSNLTAGTGIATGHRQVSGHRHTPTNRPVASLLYIAARLRCARCTRRATRWYARRAGGVVRRVRNPVRNVRSSVVGSIGAPTHQTVEGIESRTLCWHC
jgi:hypothetical protein